MAEKIRPTEIEYFGMVSDTKVYIKRDDLIPFSFGGNKVRIAEEVFAEMETRGSRAVVTYGSAGSNLNRVMVHMAKERDIPCTCIVKKEAGNSGHPSFNELMVLDSEAEIVYTEPDEVRETVSAVLSRLSAKGLEPYYIYGDETGKGGEEVLSRAYRKVFDEIVMQEKELGVEFENIVVPVGTGATLSGLIAACDEKHRILGISISNPADRVENRLQEALSSAGVKTEEIKKKDVYRITDEYLSGGYGKHTAELTAFIRSNLKERGLALDPVYSGKAFYGLMKEIEKGNVKGNCLFIHTGGLPLFFDLMEQM